MPVIKTRLDVETYAKLVLQRKAAGLPSVSALFLQKCGVLTDGKQAGEIVRRSLRNAKGKDSGFEFRLRDLFPKKDWERFSKGARLRAGRLFYEQVSTAVHGIRAVRKSPSNQQIYVVA
jgi:hypothetical protein